MARAPCARRDGGGGGGGGDRQHRRQQRRQRRRRRAASSLTALLLGVVAAAATTAAAAEAAAEATTPLFAAAGPGDSALSSAAAATAAAAADPAAAAPPPPSVEYLFDPVEHGWADEAKAVAAAAASSSAAAAAAAAAGVVPGALAPTNPAAAAANATADARRGWRARPWHSRMRELFPDVLADGHEALDLSPSRHGWSNKTGVADLASWAIREDGRRLDDFFGWRAARCPAARDPGREQSAVRSGAAFTCAEARHPPTPFPGCHVFVNHAYRFIYVRSPKSASTSIVDVLGECGNARTAGHTKPSCMKHSWEGALSVEEIERVWKDYFVFGFVRNPWKRAYSLYKYLHSDGDGLARPECGVSWDEFCEDPWGAADVLHQRDCLARSKSYTYFHMVDQWHCMRTAGGGSAVDYVGSVETGDEDWSAIVAEINRRRDAALVPALPSDSRLGVSNVRKGRVAGPYNGEHSHCLDAVSRWYACDAEKFGYLPRTAAVPQGEAAGG